MTKDASDLRKKWRRLTKDYEIYSLEHGRAFYRYRCAVDSAELQSNAKEDLTEAAESGTIESNPYGFNRIDAEHTADEDLIRTNPNYAESRNYRINCQRCCPTYEMRRRGFDVEAKPKEYKTDALSQRWKEVFQNAIWESVGTGRRDTTMQAIVDKMISYGDGARAEIYIRWQGYASAHVFIAENERGTIRFVDPQSGSAECSAYFSRIMPSKTLMARIDHLPPSNLILECCKNVAKDNNGTH